MFGYQGGDPAQVPSRKIRKRWEGQKKWPFLTAFDLNGIENPAQLASVADGRRGLTPRAAAADVAQRMIGYAARLDATVALSLRMRSLQFLAARRGPLALVDNQQQRARRNNLAAFTGDHR